MNVDLKQTETEVSQEPDKIDNRTPQEIFEERLKGMNRWGRRQEMKRVMRIMKKMNKTNG